MQLGSRFLASLLGLALASVAACSSSNDTKGTNTTSGSGGGGPAGCSDDPYACPAGDTCWIDANGAHYTCTKSGPGKEGDACNNYGGQATCGDGLSCIQLQGQQSGVCMPFCDAQHACEGGGQCVQLVLQSTSERISVCSPDLGGTGGGGGGTGGGGTGGGGGGGTGGAGATTGAGGSGGGA